MIHANRIVTVGEQECIIDRPIVLYRGDREVEVEFTLVSNEFMFSEEGNVIKSVNASHGQLVLNTPSGEHMFSELAECHEGKVVFVVTKEMIDEFIEMGFYSFQIRLYDSAEMKSRVTIPPVMNGFDIRNPIAAEDETNVVDQGIVDYARIFKDQSNEELPTFTWDGEYVKTEWAHHDVITENKMNKIEDALYSINANIKESDVVMLNAVDPVKKDADKYVKEHMGEVEAEVDEFERNLNTGVEKFKVDANAAMTAHKNEVSEVIDDFDVQLTKNTSRIEGFVNAKEFGMSEDNEDNTAILQKLVDTASTIIIPKGTYKFKSGITIGTSIQLEGNGSTFIFEGTGTFITINGGSKIFNRFKIISSLGKNSNTLQIGFDMGDRPSSNRQIRFNFVDVDGFSDAGFLVNNDWHITWKHCTIQNCGAYNKDNKTGGIVIRGEVVLSSWHGSGHIIEDCYISGCNYGFYDSGCWNVNLYNCIFEHNNYPIGKWSGRYLSLERCWFEHNNNPCRGGAYKNVGCRGFEVVEVPALEYYTSSTKPHSNIICMGDTEKFNMTEGAIRRVTFDKSSGFYLHDMEDAKRLELTNDTKIVGCKGGSANAGKKYWENSLVTLEGYGSYWTSTTANAQPVSVLSLGYTSSSSGAGKAWGAFDFKAGGINGNDIETPLRSVFGVDVSGNITSNEVNGTANIGSNTIPYNNVYCKAIVLCSPDGTLYKVTVGDDGVLKTSKL